MSLIIRFTTLPLFILMPPCSSLHSLSPRSRLHALLHLIPHTYSFFSSSAYDQVFSMAVVGYHYSYCASMFTLKPLDTYFLLRCDAAIDSRWVTNHLSPAIIFGEFQSMTTVPRPILLRSRSLHHLVYCLYRDAMQLIALLGPGWHFAPTVSGLVSIPSQTATLPAWVHYVMISLIHHHPMPCIILRTFH